MVYNMNDPMNRSIYLEQFLPTLDGMLAPLNSNIPYPWVAPIVPNMPGLAPQPTKDSWYYSNDGVNDGKISTMEKLKAFAKGGTYNMVRGMFCNKDGFSWGRTLTTAAAATAIALTGPIGAAIAGGIGLICAVDNFRNSNFKAKTAMTDQQAREAYEGYGEAATTAGLSILGGYKGGKAIKNNFTWAKTYNPTVPLKAKLMKWDVSKWFKPLQQTTPQGNLPTHNPTQQGQLPPHNPTPQGQLPPHNPTQQGQLPTHNPTPQGQLPPHNPTQQKLLPPYYPPVNNTVNPIPENVAKTYVSDWAPVQSTPKTNSTPYVSDYAPVQINQKPVANNIKNTTYVSDWSPVKTTPPQQKYNIQEGHYFG